MYLLFLDESGTHGGSSDFILGGIAVHENDVWALQWRLNKVLLDNLTPLGLSHSDFELHATDIKSPLRPRGRATGSKKNRAKVSPWTQVPAHIRFDILDEVYELLRDFQPTQDEYPIACFAAVVDKAYPDYAKRAYELVFKKFDDMLRRLYSKQGLRQRGLAIHDEHQIETDLQSWTNDWRQIGGAIGRLDNMVDVPLFSDSRASRMLQAADFVAFAVWGSYGVNDSKWMNDIIKLFDATTGAVHGLIHVWPGYKQGPCACPACSERQGRGA